MYLYYIDSELPYQAQMLVNRARAMTDVDFEKDWKLVTVFVGSNDLCYYCYDEAGLSVKNYTMYIQSALDILHAELPRTFVNMVSNGDVTPLASTSNSIICNAMHW